MSTPKPDRVFAFMLFDAAAKSGHGGTIELAAQLADVAPCKKCNYVWYACSCSTKSNQIKVN